MKERKDCNCKEPDFDILKGICKKCGNSIIHLGKRIYVNKQETLEDICNKINFINPRERVAYYNGLKNGAKWQQERSYSEEDLISLLEFNYKKDTNQLGTLRKDYSQKIVGDWFEQFKKK